MAQKRMIDKKISVSEQVANLPVEAQLIFTWSIPHADDLGLLPYSQKTLKALIVPMMEMKLDQFGKFVDVIVAQGLWQDYEHAGEHFYRIIKFKEHQTLKKDRQPQTILNVKLYEDPRQSWQELEALGFQMEGDDFQTVPEVKLRKGSKEKGSKEKEAPNGELTPKEKSILFFEAVEKANDIFYTFVQQLSQQNKVAPENIRKELKKFADYWTEPNGSGTKKRWEMEKVFDVRRRLATWFGRVGFKGFTAAQSGKGKNIIL